MQRVFIGEDRVEPVHWERCKDTGRVCVCGSNFLEAALLKLEKKGLKPEKQIRRPKKITDLYRGFRKRAAAVLASETKHAALRRSRENPDEFLSRGLSMILCKFR